ncbi:MAG: DUF4838 domain-containing protein [Victivallaceae bacterium]|nr:DUF4838 domain-containing protein [Victivallaceae bacterium]
MNIKHLWAGLALIGIITISNEVVINAANQLSLLGKQQRQNVLAPKQGRKSVITLLNNGEPAFEILIPNNPSTIDLKAAEMLKVALDAGTGKQFKIVKESSYNDGAVFSLGATALLKKSGIKPTKPLALEGYLIKEHGGNIFLLGGTLHGTISPVIALIEEDFGGRLYDRQAGLKMPQLAAKQTVTSREYIPVFPVRTMFQFESFDKNYQLFNRVGSFTSSYDFIPPEWGGSIKLPKQYFVHTFLKLLPNKAYFKTHPEYFALVDGKRKQQGHSGGGEMCLTNPDVRRIVLAKVLAELKNYHQYGMFDISANDNTSKSFCECAKCQALVKREGSQAGPLIDFVNYIANEVVKVYPNVKITTLAYKETKQPPEKLQPNKNVIVRLANDTALRPYPICYVDDDTKFKQNIVQWRQAGTQLFIWDYMVSFLAWPMPRPNLEVIGKNIDYYAKNGIYGLFLQSSHYGVGENQGKLRAWVYAHKMWDPRCKMADLIHDFNYGYFGKAAPLMQEYSDLLSAEWRKFYQTHKFKEVFVFSNNYYPEALTIFNQALNLTVDDPVLHAKIELEFISLLFYRLELMPPKTHSERDSYRHDLELFAKLTKKYQVKWISEGKTKTPKRLKEWRSKYLSENSQNHVESIKK